MAGTANPLFNPDTGNEWLDSIIWDSRWDSGAKAGKPTVVTYYIAGLQGNEVVDLDFNTITALGSIFPEESQAMRDAMSAMSTVCNIKFKSAATQAGADIIWASVSDSDADGNLGWANPPGTENNSLLGDEQSLIVSNHDAYSPTSPDPDLLVKGGYDYVTFIHELGHGLGLAHPHDTGGGSLVAPGVTAPFDSYGDFDLNQGVFTMMSYNDGWETGPLGPSPSDTYGYEIGPMAFDIAALQILYGANMKYHAGDNIYALPTANVAGTGYLCLWDAGGNDTMQGGDFGNVIDLRPATLKTEEGGGGWVSYANGIHGGFTIAKRVVIEIAIGGDGVDMLTGNSKANELFGEGGADELSGLGGNDTLTGGGGLDMMTGGTGKDIFAFLAATDSAVGSADQILDFNRGFDRIDVSAIDAISGGADNKFRLDKGGAFEVGEIQQFLAGSVIILVFNTSGDEMPEFSIQVSGTIDLVADDFRL